MRCPYDAPDRRVRQIQPRGRISPFGKEVLAMTLFLRLVWPGPADAQISPGPLSRPHHEFEGIKNCFQCHELGSKPSDKKCLDCHREIAALRDAKRGYHGIADRGECASCHLEHGGLDFALVNWGPGGSEAFDHDLAGWPLDGKHLSLECAKCHTPKLQTSKVVMAVKPKLSAKSFLGLGTACAECHDDPHEGNFGTTCKDCHTTEDFHVIRTEGFDHDKTKYPLRGAHRTVECKTCHDPKKAWGKKPKFDLCSRCHSDPHDGAATLAGRVVDCESCHKVERFFPSTFDRQDHAKTQFPLSGKHSAVDCSKCHQPKDRAATSKARAASVKFRWKSTVCADCHGDAHAGQLSKRDDGGRCESCHKVEGFAPSLFTVDHHAQTPFALDGAHRDVACKECHGTSREPAASAPKTLKLGSAGVFFHPSAKECRDCHLDPHTGRFDAKNASKSRATGECLTCHSSAAFAPSSVDAERHKTFAFPLEGAHLAVPCLECHKELSKAPAASTKKSAHPGRELAFTIAQHACVDCHKDPHAGQFLESPSKGACASCHGADAFRPAALFDHERDAAFKLEGAHEDVACAECHKTETVKGAEVIRYKPIPHQCEDCHATIPTEGKP